MTPQNARAHEPQTVSILGMGAMGTALAAALLDRGHAVTAWNRSPGRGEGLVGRVARTEEDKTFISECSANASWLVKSLDQRARRRRETKPVEKHRRSSKDPSGPAIIETRANSGRFQTTDSSDSLKVKL